MYPTTSAHHLPQYLDRSLFAAVLKRMDLWSGIPKYTSTKTSSSFPKARCNMVRLRVAISTDCFMKLLWTHLTKLALFRFFTWRKSQSIMGFCHRSQKLDVFTSFSNLPAYLFLSHSQAIGCNPIRVVTPLFIFCSTPIASVIEYVSAADIFLICNAIPVSLVPQSL